jgi:F5/8 type C domain protein
MRYCTLNGVALSNFKIDIVGNDPAVKHAAEIYRYYANKTCEQSDDGHNGIVHIGMTDEFTSLRDVQLGTDGIYLLLKDQELWLLGQNGSGTIYAVYDFFEKLGWRFLCDDYEVLITDKVNLCDFEYSYTPPLNQRTVFYSHAYDYDFMNKQRLNGLWCAKLPKQYGRSISYAGIQAHSFSELIPPAEYFPEHPEYFAMDAEGKRRPDTQPCLTEPKVFQIALEKVKVLLQENPEADFISISQNDVPERCHCKNCKALEEKYACSGASVFWFANKIARAIKDEFPKVAVEILPYVYSDEPPKGLVFSDNIAIRFTTMNFCREHQLTDEKCKYNLKQKANLDGFAKLTKNLYIWDYAANFYNYLMPIPQLYSLYWNFRYYMEKGARGIMVQASGASDDGAFDRMWNYALGKLLWEPYMDFATYLSHIREFLHLYYGKGGEYLYDFIAMTNALPKSGYHYGTCIANPDKIIPIYTGEQYLSGNVLFSKAIALATKKQKKHIEKAHLQLEWYALYLEQKNKSIDVSELQKRLRVFYKKLKKFGIDAICEGKKLPKSASKIEKMQDFLEHDFEE